MNHKPLKTGENVDAIYLNGEYQDETKSLVLNESDIEAHQYSIELHTGNNDKIIILFHSIEELEEFSKAYNLK